MASFFSELKKTRTQLSILVSLLILAWGLFFRDAPIYGATILIFAMIIFVVNYIKKNRSSQTNFIGGGYVGLQKAFLNLESIHEKQKKNQHTRYEVHSYISSYRRPVETEMDNEDRRTVFAHILGEKEINDYLNLGNQRNNILENFLLNGGYCSEVYEENRLKLYAEGQGTLHDGVKDPPKERKQRFKRLLDLLDRDNYKIYLITDSFQKIRMGPNYVILEKKGIIIDLRSTGVTENVAI